ncbi:MAG: hypothetical protein GXP55_11510 [Deltaproteobacteria bacterium]|nr:hypothetical protein [Deltaproteobacteria bacterium]
MGILLGACGGDHATQAAPEEHSARDFYAAPLEAALDDVAERLVTRGFTPEGERVRGFLVEGTAGSTPLALRSGECSVVVLEASGALVETVLRVHGPEGGELARSAGGPGHAALRYCPVNTGSYYISYSARRGSGLYALASFRGPNGIELDLAALFPESSAEAEP